MTAFILRRSLQSLIVLFVMSLLVFGGVNMVGDPVDMLISPEADQMEIDRVIRDLGLDRPVTEQYWYFLVYTFDRLHDIVIYDRKSRVTYQLQRDHVLSWQDLVMTT